MEKEKGSPMADPTPALADAPPTTDTTTTTTTTSAPSSSTKPTHTAPPPEPPRAQWTRTLVIFFFWAVILFLGLPMWWKTTTVHREQIPIEEMQSWADGKSCRPVFPLQIVVEAPEIPLAEAEALLQMTQHTLDDLNDFSAHHLRLRLTESPVQEEREQEIETPAPSSHPDVDVDTALTIKLTPRATSTDIETPTASLLPHSETLQIQYSPHQLPSPSKPAPSTSSALATFIAREVQALFTEEKATIAYILSNSNTLSPTTQPAITTGFQTTLISNREQGASVVKSLPPDLVHALQQRQRKAFRYAETYHLSISLFTPGPAPSSWDVDAAVETYLAPLLDAFSPIANFTIDTQVQVYATFSELATPPLKDETTGASTLDRDNLGAFINAAEWPLGPGFGKAPTINLLLYVPAREQSPLVIRDTAATSWVIPQWGSVVILNVDPENADLLLDAPPTNPTHLRADVLRPAFATFARHLLALLGVPAQPAQSLPLRLNTLVRVHTASLLLSASSTMGSLARLTQSLPAIPIPASVAAATGTTLGQLGRTCEHLREGRFMAAFRSARVAERQAERGFFEKSMVGQVYFPDEHKVAVYLPLMGPVGVPLVIGLIREGRRLVGVWKGRGRGRG